MGFTNDGPLPGYDLASLSAPQLAALQQQFQGMNMRLRVDFADDETAFLLRNPGNAQMLFDSIMQDEEQDLLTPAFPTED